MVQVPRQHCDGRPIAGPGRRDAEDELALMFDAPRTLVRSGDTYPTDADGFRLAGAWWAETSQHSTARDLRPAHSFAILGEPGIGKTTTIKQVVADLPSAWVPVDEAARPDELSHLLRQAVASLSPHDGAFVILDGIDESPLPVKALIRRLQAFMELSPINVALGCRSGSWDAALAAMLKEARPGFCEYELLPLSVDDVRQAAHLNGLNDGAFVDAVREAGAAALAMRPLTLNMLIDTFQESGRLPEHPAELFALGLTRLANEHDTTRTEAVGSPEQRLAVAERVAACLAMSGAATVTLMTPTSGTELSAGSLSAGEEWIASGRFAVSPDLVGETLLTALFQGRGAQRFGVGHASFGAFLAAQYLLRRGLTEAQLRALLSRTPASGRAGVPSQLREVTAWLVSLDPDKNSWLVELDAEAMLAHTAYVRDHEVRRLLVDRLLVDEELAITTRMTKWRLFHPTLASQLAPALAAPLSQDAGDDFTHPVSRAAATAIDVARASKVRELNTALGELVGATSINPYLRARAANALADLDPDAATLALEPVLDEVLEHPQRDPDDDLKGIALQMCMHRIPVETLARILSVPKRDNYYGAYAGVLGNLSELLSDAQVKELVAVARDLGSATMAAETAGDDEDDGPTRNLLALLGRRSDSVLDQLSWRIIAIEVREASGFELSAWLLAHSFAAFGRPLAPAAVVGDGSGTATQEQLETRRKLGLAVAKSLPTKHVGLITRGLRVATKLHSDEAPKSVALVGKDDFAWLLSTETDLDSGRLALLTQFAYTPELPEHVEVAYLHRDDPKFPWLRPWFETMPIDGPEARQWKELFQESGQEWAGRSEHEEHLRAVWERCQRGETSAVPELVAQLRIDPETGYYESFTTDGLMSWPGHKTVDISKAELTEVCISYLKTAVAPSGEWLADARLVAHKAIEQFAMLELVADQLTTADLVACLPASAWSDLAPVVIRSHRLPAKDDASSHAKLINSLRTQTPGVLRTGYLRWIDDQLRVDADTLSPLWPLETVWDSTVEEALMSAANDVAKRLCLVMERLASVDPKPEPGTPAAQELASAHQRRRGLEFSLRRIAECYLNNAVLDRSRILSFAGSDYCNAVRAVVMLPALSSEEMTWTEVWEQCLPDADLTHKVLDGLAAQLDWERSTLSLLTPDELATLWRWVESHYSADNDAWDTGFVTSERRIRDLRDAAVIELETRSTAAALEALGALAQDHSGSWFLRSHHRAAEERFRDETWEGTGVTEFMQMADDASLTVIHDSDALFRLTCALLDSLSERLEHGVAEMLWNEIPPPTGSPTGTKATWRPKHEAQLSVLIADHLKTQLDRGLVVNREVQVRDTTSRGHGLAVDVLASGGQVDREGRLPQCPIEVKGNWNGGLLTDLREQLVDDYMKDTAAQVGIYVCGWFEIADWTDQTDARRETVAKRSREDVTQQLGEAALLAEREKQVTVEVRLLHVRRNVPSARSDKASR
jgi:hypothetical protein